MTHTFHLHRGSPRQPRVLVVGAGLSGLATALMLQQAGCSVTISTRGVGGLLLSNGTIDVLGWRSTKDQKPVKNPWAALPSFIENHPEHPYAAIGVDSIFHGVRWLTDTLPFFDSQTVQTRADNSLIPTAIGTLHPSAVLAHSMSASAFTPQHKYLLIDISHMKDFSASYAAANLKEIYPDVQIRTATISVPVRGKKETDSLPTSIARGLDGYLNTRERTYLIDAILAERKPGETILLPAVLGVDPNTFATIAQELDCPVGEILLPPPSIPGRRINDYLVNLTQKARIDTMLNSAVCGCSVSDGRITDVHVHIAGRIKHISVDAVVHAGGGFESGAIARDSYGKISETIFNLPVFAPHDTQMPISSGDDSRILHPQLRSLLAHGVRVNSAMQPIAETDGDPIYTNLYCVGGILGGSLPWEEASGEGIALGSAYCAAQKIVKDLHPAVPYLDNIDKTAARKHEN